MEEVQLRAAAKQNVDTEVEQRAVTGGTGKAEATGKNAKSKSSNSSSTEQDLDTFLLGDLEDSDEAPGILLKVCLAFVSETTCSLTRHFELTEILHHAAICMCKSMNNYHP